MPWPSFRLSPEQLDHLPTEIDDLAIGLGLNLITTDDADGVSCVRHQLGNVRLLTLRVPWRDEDYQNRN